MKVGYVYSQSDINRLDRLTYERIEDEHQETFMQVLVLTLLLLWIL